MKSNVLSAIKLNKILEWYCREGSGWTYPDCDKCDKNTEPCFNYKILKEMLTGKSQFKTKK